VLGKRLEDLDYRIAQYRREGQQEMRLQRRRKALLASHSATHDLLEGFNGVLLDEEAKLEQGMGIFHHGLERLMVEDMIEVENLSVLKAATQYTSLTERLEDIEGEVKDINSVLEHRKDHYEQLDMLVDWRDDVYDRADRADRTRNALLHKRLDAWLLVADREDDLDDLDEAAAVLEDTLMALEASIAAGTRVRHVTKRDLAVISNLQPARTKQFLLMETFRNVTEAFVHASRLLDKLQGIEHLTVHIRDPQRMMDSIVEALLLDFYEGDRPRHALHEIHEQHRYMLQLRDAIRKRKGDVRKEIEGLKVKEDELLIMAIDRRLKHRSNLNRW
jgi:hypothetical protein